MRCREFELKDVGGPAYVLQVLRWFLRNLFRGAGRFSRPPYLIAGRFRNGIPDISRSFFFFLARCRCCRFRLGVLGIGARQFAFQVRQLGAVLQHFPQQAPLRLDGSPLFHHQHGQDCIRSDEQNDQQRKQTCPRLLWSCAWRRIDECHGAPKLTRCCQAWSPTMHLSHQPSGGA